jgi:hypothetical protein
VSDANPRNNRRNHGSGIRTPAYISPPHQPLAVPAPAEPRFDLALINPVARQRDTIRIGVIGVQQLRQLSLIRLRVALPFIAPPGGHGCLRTRGSHRSGRAGLPHPAPRLSARCTTHVAHPLDQEAHAAISCRSVQMVQVTRCSHHRPFRRCLNRSAASLPWVRSGTFPMLSGTISRL